MNLRTLTILSAGALLGTLALAATADQIYKWVDKNGQVHYSQTPPPTTDVQAQSVNIGAPPPDPITLQNQQNLAQQIQQKNQQDQEAAKKQQQDAQQQAAQKKHCDVLRERLATLQVGGRTATVDTKGNVSYLSDDERNKQIKDAQDQIAKECSGSP
ncbi:MAG: DUF4124 domain-containing protein [Bacillota bacterium]